jgi:hypothetical protein
MNNTKSRLLLDFWNAARAYVDRCQAGRPPYKKSQIATKVLTKTPLQLWIFAAQSLCGKMFLPFSYRVF